MSESAKAELPSEPILRLEPGMHAAPINRIDVDAGESFLVTGSDDKTVRVWALDDGRPLARLRVPIGEGNVGKVYAVAISPDGERIAAGGWLREGDDSIYIFERASGRIVKRIDGLPDVILHLAFSPDGRHLVACLHGPKGIRVYETAGFGEVAADDDYGDLTLWAAFDRNGRLVTGSFDGRIRLYDSDFRLIESQTAPGGERRPYGAAFSPDDAQIAVAYHYSTRIDVLDGGTLAPLFEADTADITNGNLMIVAWSADGRFLYAAGQWGRSGTRLVRRWADGGRGACEDIALSQDTIMDLRPLALGGQAFGAQDPTLGVLGADGRIFWRQDPAQADLRDQYDHFAASPNGIRVAFGFDRNSPAAFDLVARRLALDPRDDDGAHGSAGA